MHSDFRHASPRDEVFLRRENRDEQLRDLIDMNVFFVSRVQEFVQERAF